MFLKWNGYYINVDHIDYIEKHVKTINHTLYTGHPKSDGYVLIVFQSGQSIKWDYKGDPENNEWFESVFNDLVKYLDVVETFP